MVYREKYPEEWKPQKEEKIERRLPSRTTYTRENELKADAVQFKVEKLFDDTHWKAQRRQEVQYEECGERRAIFYYYEIRLLYSAISLWNDGP